MTTSQKAHIFFLVSFMHPIDFSYRYICIWCICVYILMSVPCQAPWMYIGRTRQNSNNWLLSFLMSCWDYNTIYWFARFFVSKDKEMIKRIHIIESMIYNWSSAIVTVISADKVSWWALACISLRWVARFLVSEWVLWDCFYIFVVQIYDDGYRYVRFMFRLIR